jgi:hypothetical protein
MSTAADYGNLGGGIFAMPRRLGAIFPRQRSSYLLYLPLTMTAMAIMCWVAPNDTMLMFGSVFLGAIATYLGVELIFKRGPIRVSTMIVIAQGLGYGIGTANTWFTLPRGGESVAAFLHHDPVAVTHTMGTVLFSMAVLLSVGEAFEKPLFGEEFELLLSHQAIIFISVGVVVLIGAYAHGSLNYMGASHGDNGQLGVFPSFAAWLIGTLFAVTLLAALNARTATMRRYLSLLAALQFLLEIPMGRRALIYTVIVALIVLRLGPHRFHWSWLKRIVVGAVLVGVLYLSTIAFYYLRLAGYTTKASLSIVDRVSLAIDYYEQKDYSEVKEQFASNVQTRTFIIGFLADLEQNAEHFTPALGRGLIGQIQSAIPSVLYPEKDRYYGEEGLSDEIYGTTYLDEANSVLTAGALDFGTLGMIVYPVVLALLLRFFFEFIGQSLPTFVATIIIIAGFGEILEAEDNLVAYFIIMRNGLLFGSIVWLFIAMPALRLRKDN